MKKIYILFLILLFSCVLILKNAYAAGPWDYKVNATDTPAIIDTSTTTANVNINSNEICLPNNTSSVIAFWPDGSPDYILMTPTKIIHMSFDGTSYTENTILEIVPESVPTGVAAPSPFPDVKLAVGTEIRHMSFDGTGYARNTPLEKTGMDDLYTISSHSIGSFATITGNQAQRFMFDGSDMVRVTDLEPGTLNFPIDVELFPDSLNMATLEIDKLRLFRWDDSGSPLSTITVASGLTDPIDICATGTGDIALIDGNSVQHFSFDGNITALNSVLTITGLENPKAVALRHGTLDRIIVVGDEARYYRWDGNQLVYDTQRSKIVPGIGSSIYRTNAVVQSQATDPGAIVSMVRVRAAHELPSGTAVTWSVTADGVNWTKRWRVRGMETGTVCEISSDNGVTWESIGNANASLPDTANTELWADVIPGVTVKWIAELSTSDPNVTPKIASSPRGGVAVRWDTNTSPNKPQLPSYGTCFLSSTPTLSWVFSDPDPDDLQTAYQLQVVKASDPDQLIIDSGKVISNIEKYRVPTSTQPDVPGPLWNSGDYKFKYRVKVWDQADIESPWSDYADFCVIAFDRPRISQIASVPLDDNKPDPMDLTTHFIITPGMTEEELPVAKAGAKVTLLVDVIGPLNSITPKFPYTGPRGEETSYVMISPLMSDGVTSNPLHPSASKTNRWSIDFWTDPSLEICPSGTIVKMQMTGTGSEGDTQLNAPPYAAGIIKTHGSIYEDWIVVPHGRD